MVREHKINGLKRIDTYKQMTKQRYTNPKREALRMAQHHRQSRFFQLKQMANFWPMPSRRFNYCFVPAKPKQSITTGHEGEE
jgi:hypothetical protein